MEWQISDQDIQAVEELLLPHSAHFPDDAREVIRCWHSTDIAACPGSGKTTVLLAKLKLLADRMPLENVAGICVLSHTNVAVNEIKNRLSDYADRLLNYPNYIGTIQSFIDRFVTMPYLRNISGQNVQVVDSLTFAQQVLSKMQHDAKYSTLDYVTKNNFETGKQFSERINHTQALYIRDDGALCIGRQQKPLAGAGKASAEQYKKLLVELLENEGMIRYQDAYVYASTAIGELPAEYANLFSSRFQYVFIDEYQDCNNLQRQAIDAIFDPQKCAVFKIGDSDQAIYNSAEDTTPDWMPQPDFLPIITSCRFNQEIGNVLCKLKKGEKNIVMVTLGTGVGGGVILEGHPLVGTNGAGGEIGHICVNETETETCGCGKKGCLEQYASATGIARLAALRLAKDAKSSLLRSQEHVDAKAVFDALKAQDEVAEEIVEEFGKYLGHALANIAVVVDPAVIVIGGGVSKAGEILLDYIVKNYRANAFFANQDVQFKLAELGNDAGICGAAKLIFD